MPPSRPSVPSDVRPLLQTLPLPLAQLVLRALNAKNAPERHHSAYYLAECTIKLAASARIGVWLEHAALSNSDMTRRLESLVLPSMGHWCELLREISRDLSGRKDAALLPLAALGPELSRNRPEWTAVRALIERAQAEECVPGDGAKQSLKRGALGFFDIVVAYRNEVIGHGAQRSNAYYDDMGALLLAATLEVLGLPALFGGMELAHARSSESGKLEFHGFTGLAGVPLGQLAEGARAGELYLIGPMGRISLHPLVVFGQDEELGRERIGFINRTIRKSRKGADGDVEEIRRTDYLDYASGQTLSGVDSRAAVTALLARLRGKTISAVDIATAENATLSDASADASEETAQQSAVIGDFELLGELGRGSMGIVYKARQRSLKRLVALKVLPPSLSDDPIARKRFSREISALARCDHPNVVKILASGEDGARIYYAMEYVEGADLGRAYTVLSSWRGTDVALREGHLAAAISMSEGATKKDASLQDLPELERIPAPPVLAGRDLAERLTELFADVAEGLAHLHAAGVIHRDLKPSNLMLTADGNRIVIMDLGLARLADESKALTTSDVKILGTLRYMAPEQLQRQLIDVDARADIYGLGATLYELVTCRRVFDGDTEQRLIYQVLHDTPLAPRRVEPRISTDLAAVLSTAMAKSPSDRYPSAQAMADDLRAIAERRPIRARPPGVFRRVTLWFRRTSEKHGFAVAAGLIVLLAFFGVWSIRSAMAPRLCSSDDVDDCAKQCTRGHAGSCHALGVLYEHGSGVAKDEVRAAALFRKACDTGHVIACCTLGSMRLDGKGGAVDYQESAELYLRGCDENNAQCCNLLARVYQYGAGVSHDMARAAELYKKSCERGYATACSNLGRLLDDGTGVPRDAHAAHLLYEKSCTLGSAAGCGNLATSYVDGIFVKQDHERAFSLYTQGCDGGYSFACTGLGTMYENGQGVAKDPERAASLYKHACNDGFPPACSSLGLLYDSGTGVPKDEGRARVLYQQACEKQEAIGCFHLAEMLTEGRAVPKDERRALALFGDLCRRDMARACTSLSEFYRLGQVIPVNLARADELRQKACAGGDEQACTKMPPPKLAPSSHQEKATPPAKPVPPMKSEPLKQL